MRLKMPRAMFTKPSHATRVRELELDDDDVERKEDQPQADARQRAGDGDDRLLARAAGVPVERRRATEDEELDARDPQTEAACDEGVRQLVRERPTRRTERP